MAFAAVHSLLHTIKGLLYPSRIPVATSAREILQSAHDHACSLEFKLYSCSEWVTDLDELIIIEEAHKLEDAIEIPFSNLSLSPTLNQLREDVDCFARTAKEMEENIEESWKQKALQMIEECIKELFVPGDEDEDEDVSSECDHMVGLSDQFLMIRKTLDPNPVKKRIPPSDMITWISGMAGIGKTTIAKKIYHDLSVKANFECRAFVTVGNDFRVMEVLQAIAAQLNLDYEKIIMERYGNISRCFLRIAIVRKSLIVLDDVWDATFVHLLRETWTQIKDTGSRILVTSRIDVDRNRRFTYCKNAIKMRFMNEEESWELLKKNVFGDLESCPPQLVKPGKKIAEKCEGLPLRSDHRGCPHTPLQSPEGCGRLEPSSRKTTISFGGCM